VNSDCQVTSASVPLLKFPRRDLAWFVGNALQWATLLGSVFCGVLGGVYVLFGFFAAGGRQFVLCVGIGLMWWYVRGERLGL
jgi:hypothetical protein